MTTQDQGDTFVQYAGDGIQTIFLYRFQVDSASDLKVFLNGVIETGYTLTGLGKQTGGNLIFFAPPPYGSLVHAERDTALVQLTDFVSNDPFDAAAQEAEHDNSRHIDQDTRTRFSLVPMFRTSIPQPYRNMRIPDPAPLKLLGFNSDGTQLSLYEPALVTVIPSPVSGLTWGKSTQTVIAVAGMRVLPATVLFPAGCLGLGVTLRVLTPCGASNGLTTASLGDAGTVDAWGSELAVRTMLVSNAGMWRRAPWFMVPTALDVLITADGGGLFDNTGALKVTAHFLIVTPDL